MFHLQEIISIVCLNYRALALKKRFQDYETLARKTHNIGVKASLS